MGWSRQRFLGNHVLPLNVIAIKHRGKAKTLTPTEWKHLKRHQAIEPIIGHLKQDHRMDRCHLKGEMGDRIHAVLCAAGYNLRWLLRMIVKKGITFLYGLYLRLRPVLAQLEKWLEMSLQQNAQPEFQFAMVWK